MNEIVQISFALSSVPILFGFAPASLAGLDRKPCNSSHRSMLASHQGTSFALVLAREPNVIPQRVS